MFQKQKLKQANIPNTCNISITKIKAYIDERKNSHFNFRRLAKQIFFAQTSLNRLKKKLEQINLTPDLSQKAKEKK